MVTSIRAVFKGNLVFQGYRVAVKGKQLVLNFKDLKGKHQRGLLSHVSGVDTRSHLRNIKLSSQVVTFLPDHHNEKHSLPSSFMAQLCSACLRLDWDQWVTRFLICQVEK